MVVFTGVQPKSTDTENIMVNMAIVAQHVPKDVERIVIAQKENPVIECTIFATAVHVHQIHVRTMAYARQITVVSGSDVNVKGTISDISVNIKNV